MINRYTELSGKYYRLGIKGNTVFDIISAHPLIRAHLPFLADFYTINNQKYLNFLPQSNSELLKGVHNYFLIALCAYYVEYDRSKMIWGPNVNLGKE